jgi:hypothetical protein
VCTSLHVHSDTKTDPDSDNPRVVKFCDRDTGKNQRSSSSFIRNSAIDSPNIGNLVHRCHLRKPRDLVYRNLHIKPQVWSQDLSWSVSHLFPHPSNAVCPPGEHLRLCERYGLRQHTSVSKYRQRDCVYYEAIKRELNRILIYECRCDERLKIKSWEVDSYHFFFYSKSFFFLHFFFSVSLTWARLKGRGKG